MRAVATVYDRGDSVTTDRAPPTVIDRRYSGNKNMRWHYFLHLTVWTIPILAGQWALGWRVYSRNFSAVFFPPLLATVFF